MRRCPICPGRPALSALEIVAEEAEADVSVDFDKRYEELLANAWQPVKGEER